MPDMRMKLIIEALNQTGAVFNELKRQLGETGTETQGLTRQMGGLEGSVKGVVQAAVGIGTIAGMVLLVKQAVGESLKFLGQLETFGLGIATSFMTGGKYIDEVSGKALSAEEALKAAQRDAKGVIEELQVANFQTLATLDQLVRAYQETLPVAMAKGFNRQQVKEFTVATVQAAGAIGLSLDMLAEETRSLLMGTINPRTSRIGVALGLTNEDIRQNSHNAQQLFDFLMGKLAAFRAAGIESQNTWTGLWSNTKDIAKQVGGMAFEPLFQAIKYELKNLTDSIVTIDEKTQKIKWNPEFLEGIRTFKSIITSVIAELYRMGMLLDKIGKNATFLGFYATGGNFTETGRKMLEWNRMYQERYRASEKALQDLAMREAGFKPLTKEMQDYAAKKGKTLNVETVETSEGQTLQYVRDEQLKGIGYQQNPEKESEQRKKEAISAAQAALKVRLEALKGEEKLEVERIETRKALLDQEYQDALVGTEEYLQKKRALEEEALRYSIGNAAKEIEAIQGAYDVIIAKQADQEDRTKAAGERDQKILAIRNEIALKEEKLVQSSIKGTTDLAKLRKDLAEIEREGVLKALEEQKDLTERRLQLEEKSATKSPAEAVKERYEWEKKILELKREQLLEGMLAEGDDRKRARMYEEYLRILEKIGNLPERQKIDTGIADLDAQRDAYETIKEYAQGYRLFQEEQLERLAKRMRQAGIDEVDIERWKTGELKKYALQRAQFVLENTDDLGEATAARFGIMALQMRKEAQIFADGLAEAFEGGFQTINSVFFDALEGRMKSFGDYMQAFGRIVRKVLADIATELLKATTLKAMGFGGSGGSDWLSSALSFGASLFGGGSGMAAPDFSFGDNEFLTWEGRADGGPVTAKRPYWVGERGIPELFVPETNGTIIPQAALAGMGGSLTVSVPVTIDGGSKRLADRLQRRIERAVQDEIKGLV